MDRGAWWATVHRVAQNQTRLKRLSTHSPFTFKVMSSLCGPITIFFIVLGLFFIGLFFLLCLGHLL